MHRLYCQMVVNYETDCTLPTGGFMKKVLSVYTHSMTTIYLSLSAQVAISTFFMYYLLYMYMIVLLCLYLIVVCIQYTIYILSDIIKCNPLYRYLFYYLCQYVYFIDIVNASASFASQVEHICQLYLQYICYSHKYLNKYSLLHKKNLFICRYKKKF